MEKKFNCKLPTADFIFRPAIKAKNERPKKPTKVITRKLLAVAVLKDNNYVAEVITKSIEGYTQDITVMPFSNKSFDLRNKTNVWYKKPDKNGKYTRVDRNDIECHFFPGAEDTYQTMAPDRVFDGYIVIEDNIKKFDIANYKFIFKRNINLNNFIYKNRNDGYNSSENDNVGSNE